MLKVSDIANRTGQLTEVRARNLVPLPPPYDRVEDLPARKQLKPEVLDRIDTSLDGFSALGFSRPQTPEDEQRFVERVSLRP